jgi:ArsR family transcriptional regulator
VVIKKLTLGFLYIKSEKQISTCFDISTSIELSKFKKSAISQENQPMETKSVITALAALAQESRLAVFRLLVSVGPEGLAASKIAEQLELPASSLSFHLKELSHADLIVARQDGRFIIYSANFAAMNELIAFLTESCCGGNPCGPASLPKATAKMSAPKSTVKNAPKLPPKRVSKSTVKS